MITYTRGKNIVLTVLCYLYLLVRGGANKKLKTPPKRVVALYLTKNIGDMIFATPVFRALKKEYPNCHLTVIGVGKNKIILEANPDIDEYIICPDRVRSLVSLIRNVRADYGVSFASSSVDLASMYLGGVKSISMFSVENADAHASGYKALLPLCIQIPYFIGKYVAQEYLRLLEPIGIYSTDTQKYLYFTEVGKKCVLDFFDKNGVNIGQDRIAIFSPGAGTKIKQWPAERFAEVADHLVNKYGVKIAVIGGPGDRAETDLFIESVKSTKSLVYVDSSLDEMKAFISYGFLLLANDSGPVYMAEAFGVPTLVVVGPTDENEHPPKGEKNRIVSAPNRGKAEMSGHPEDFDEKNARRQIEEVTSKSVLEEIDDLIYTIGAKNL
ncbi:MAG: heptosyltransferase II [Parcubacteria bacterium C7867-005]|nr:MAG: heptosyltransferase II [Parcubacteria bacterium C7867-005]